MAFRMTIGHPRPWPGYPRHTGLISAAMTDVIATYSSNPRFRHQLSSDPASRWAPLPRRMVPVITVHRGLTPLECTSLLDTPGETACPTKKSSQRANRSRSCNTKDGATANACSPHKQMPCLLRVGQHQPRQRAGQLAALHYELPVHQHEVDSFRILMGLGKCRLVANRGGIEDHHIGGESFPK
jgi:hypothetical protein